jgi:hypothetical protein
MPENRQPGRLTKWLASMPTPVFMAFAMASAFSTYFCMYAFRKPFSAAEYEGLLFLGTKVELKTAFVISQIVGYTLSKVIGIKVCSEVSRGKRTPMLVAMIFAAQLTLLLFAAAPDNLKVVAIFFNGMSLGMVWGMVVWYLEGRRMSEMLLAGLSCSFIIASGVVKDIGVGLMDEHSVDQFWMPFATGLIFLPPFLLSVWLLNQIPQPTDEDVQARVKRRTMDSSQRWRFIRQFLPGLVMLLVAYFFLTAYRDFRDSFGKEIFEQLGYGGKPAIFTRCELWVAFGVVAALAMLNLIKSNRWGLIGAFAIMTAGAAMMGVGTLLFDAQRIGGLTWMVLCGLGSYLAYVPYGTVLFERLIASTRTVGTAVFAIYVADSIGYSGSITVMLSKDVLAGDVSRLEFFRYLTYFMSVLGVVLLIASCVYFLLFHDMKQDNVQEDTI